MNPIRRERLAAAGVDVEDALARFLGSEAMLERFWGKFLEDQNYARLEEAVRNQDWTAALAAHAGPGLHSPAGAGTHREGPCRSRRVTSRIARKFLPRPTLIRKLPSGEARAARDLGSANLPLRGLFPLPAPQTF